MYGRKRERGNLRIQIRISKLTIRRERKQSQTFSRDKIRLKDAFFYTDIHWWIKAN